MDEYQLGIPASAITDEKVIKLDLSKFNLSDKKEKKAAKGLLEKSASRFHSRQLKSKNLIWSNPVIDINSGTATLRYSLVGQMCVESFESTGRDFNIGCEITGNYMCGKNWSDCH